MDQESNLRGAGGTPGGIGEFLLGLGMTVAGGYLFTKQVTIMSAYWTIWGYNAFGLSLVPLLLGIGWLFFDGRSLLAKLLVFAGAVIILMGVIANLNIYFQPTSLYNT